MNCNFIIIVSDWGFYFQLLELVESLSILNQNVIILCYNISNKNLQSLKFFEGENVKIYNYYRSKLFENSSIYRFIKLKDVKVQNSENIKNILIFFEKPSLILFNTVSKKISNKVVFYWSLELYLNKNEEVFKHLPSLGYHLNLERKLLPKIDFLIIQDMYRAEFFCGTAEINKFYWPVTVSERRVAKQKLTTDSHLIYIGVIRPERMLDSLFDLTNKYGFKLSLNGTVNEKYKSRILTKYDNIQFSFAHNIEDMEISGQIGVVWYDANELNDSLTGSSSEKIAIYLYHGIPFITNIKNKSFNHLFLNKVAFFVDNQNFNNVINEILVNYTVYKINAKNEYLRYYNSDSYFSRFFKEVSKI